MDSVHSCRSRSENTPEKTIRRIHGKGGDIVETAYSVFPGIELVYSDAHAQEGALAGPGDDVLEISHCKEGRTEFRSGSGFYYLAPGDLSVAVYRGEGRHDFFPTGHYHGVTVRIHIAQAPECLSCLMDDVNVRPAVLAEKLCADRCFITRSSPHIEHVFSELYCVPEGIRKGYFKVKVLELLLFVSALDAAQEQDARHFSSGAQLDLARRVSEYLTANMDTKITLDALSRHFLVSPGQIKSSFQSVYGMSAYAYIRTQRMQGAAELLKNTDRTVLDIAMEFGYDNASKFAKAFRDIMGASPMEYRSGTWQNSFAPDAGE